MTFFCPSPHRALEKLYHSHTAYQKFTDCFFSNKFNIHMHVRYGYAGGGCIPPSTPITLRLVVLLCVYR